MAASSAREAALFATAEQGDAPEQPLRSTVLRVLFKASAPLGLGFALGAGCHATLGSSVGSRLRLPEAPVSESEQLQAPIVDDGIYPPPFLIGNNRVCGAARCHPGDVCCPAAPGFGFACGGSDAVCCQGNRGSVVCGANGQCCRNRHGASYCCAPGNFCESDVCVAVQGTHCFPGHAVVDVKGIGRVAVREVEIGQHVLVERPGNVLAYEPVLDYIHAGTETAAEFVTILHSRGELPMSANHIVFVITARGLRVNKPASDLQIGDKVALPGNEFTADVIALRKDVGKNGMFAPLTASGTILVNEALASTYASVGDALSLTHAAMHASYFVVRMYSNLAAIAAGGEVPPLGYVAFMALSPLLYRRKALLL
eukprot:TRINITY_DN23074_c0_g1_i1.p1 TRINITY_DN23074_c0_g1~~TRINITY_DN23074_c0_g1_i1.p1  ORF type:complete len:395 (-),score=45.05 TRINITY_DN23074_c0_g1_i1:209-1318(-)